MRGFRAHYEKFKAANVEIIEISCDSLAVQKAWAESMTDDDLPDFWPHGEVTKAYDVFNDERGNSRRSVFIIDAEGVIRWSNVYTDSIPASGEILHEIEQL